MAIASEPEPRVFRFMRKMILITPVSMSLHASDKSESALPKSNLRVHCQVLRAIARPASSPTLQQIHSLHHGLLGSLERLFRFAGFGSAGFDRCAIS